MAAVRSGLWARSKTYRGRAGGSTDTRSYGRAAGSKRGILNCTPGLVQAVSWGPGLTQSMWRMHVRVAAALALGVIGMAAGSLDAAVEALIG